MNLDPDNTILLSAFCIKAGLIPAVWGPPGCGKTTLTPALALSLGYLTPETYEGGDFYNRTGYSSFAMSYTMPEDIAGLATKGEDGTIERLHDAHIKVVCDEPGLLVIDEANRFPTTATANVALRLMQERMAGDRCLHSKTGMILLMNPTTSDGARELPPAFANRVTHLEYNADPMKFIDYMMGGKGMIPELPSEWPEVKPAHKAHAQNMVAAFLKANPLKAHMEPKPTAIHDKPWGRDVSGPWPSWRSWKNYSDVIALVMAFGDIRRTPYADIIHNIGLGTIGPVASEFYHFLTKSDLRSGAEVLDTPGAYVVPGRIDVLWAEVMSASIEARRRDTLAAWHRCLDVYRAVTKYGMPEVPTVALPYLLGMNQGGVGLSQVMSRDLINQTDIRQMASGIAAMTGIYKA